MCTVFIGVLAVIERRICYHKGIQGCVHNVTYCVKLSQFDAGGKVMTHLVHITVPCAMK